MYFSSIFYISFYFLFKKYFILFRSKLDLNKNFICAIKPIYVMCYPIFFY
jgi:hypothetical protein